MADPKGTGEIQTLVEEGTELKGSLSSSCAVVVRGRIDGEIQAPSLNISNSGAVQGRVKVGEIKSQGEIAGEIDADVVQLSGRVRDNTVIRAKSLEVKLTPQNGRMQVVFGECELDVGDAPRRADVAGKAGESAKRGRSSSKEASANGGTQPPPAGPGGTIPPAAGEGGEHLR